MSESNLSIQSAAEQGGSVVTIAGEIDLRSSPALRGTLLEMVESRATRVIIDLSGVSYIDSSGVGTLVEFKRKLERVGGRIVLAGMQPRVKSVFEITRLDRFFLLADGVAEARKL